MPGVYRPKGRPRARTRAKRRVATKTAALVAGTPSFSNSTTTTINLTTTAGSGGAAPITLQWQRSTVSGSGFSNLGGQTSSTLADSDTLSANTRYYYRVVFTDSIAQTATSAEAFGALPHDPAGGGGTIIIVLDD